MHGPSCLALLLVHDALYRGPEKALLQQIDQPAVICHF